MVLARRPPTMQARNSLGRSVSLLNDVEPSAPHRSPTAPKAGGLLRTMSESNTRLVPVSSYQCPPELLRTQSSGSSMNRTPSPPTPCIVDEAYTHSRQGANPLDKPPHGYAFHPRRVSRSYSDESEWLISPPASPPISTPSLMRHINDRDAPAPAGSGQPADSPPPPRQEDARWALTAPHHDKHRYTWSPPPDPMAPPRL